MSASLTSTRTCGHQYREAETPSYRLCHRELSFFANCRNASPASHSAGANAAARSRGHHGQCPLAQGRSRAEGNRGWRHDTGISAGVQRGTPNVCPAGCADCLCCPGRSPVGTGARPRPDAAAGYATPSDSGGGPNHHPGSPIAPTARASFCRGLAPRAEASRCVGHTDQDGEPWPARVNCASSAPSWNA